MNIHDLNKHLFNQLNRLEGDLDEDELRRESTRSKAINDIANTVLVSARLSLEAERFKQEVVGSGNINLPMLENRTPEQAD